VAYPFSRECTRVTRPDTLQRSARRPVSSGEYWLNPSLPRSSASCSDVRVAGVNKERNILCPVAYLPS
jgi:hypothetical protein